MNGVLNDRKKKFKDLKFTSVCEPANSTPKLKAVERVELIQKL